MAEMISHTTRQENASDSVLHYWVEIYKDGQFYEHIEFKGYSGTAVHEEVRELRHYYRASNGYEVRW